MVHTQLKTDIIGTKIVRLNFRIYANEQMEVKKSKELLMYRMANKQAKK